MSDIATTTPPSKTILVVEDDRFLRDIIVTHLRRAQYTVVCATTGEEALDMAAAEHIDLIILDIVLSGINGLDVIARLQQQEATKAIPFMVFSNSDEPASLSRGKELGAVTYLVKALSTPERIVTEVTNFLQSKQ